jgi:hypothetical protein
MTIHNVNMRDDWYIGTHDIGTRRYVSYGVTLSEVIINMIKQIIK